MSKIILVTGGSRSGKSDFAEGLCRYRKNDTAYIATSIPFDEEMKERVRKHREKRGSEWTTYEIYRDVYKEIKNISNKHETVILDCVTLLVNNLMFDYSKDIDKLGSSEIDDLLEFIKFQITNLIVEIKKTDLFFVFVTNELGMGIVPANKTSRVYSDVVGKINQYIAKESDETYFTVSGIPIKIKG